MNSNTLVSLANHLVSALSVNDVNTDHPAIKAENDRAMISSITFKENIVPRHFTPAHKLALLLRDDVDYKQIENMIHRITGWSNLKISSNKYEKIFTKLFQCDEILVRFDAKNNKILLISICKTDPIAVTKVVDIPTLRGVLIISVLLRFELFDYFESKNYPVKHKCNLELVF